MWIESIFTNNVLAEHLAQFCTLESLVRLYSTCTQLRDLFYDPYNWGVNVLGLAPKWQARFMHGKVQNVDRLLVTATGLESRTLDTFIDTENQATPDLTRPFQWMYEHPTFCRGGCGKFSKIPLFPKYALQCKRCFVPTHQGFCDVSDQGFVLLTHIHAIVLTVIVTNTEDWLEMSGAMKIVMDMSSVRQVLHILLTQYAVGEIVCKDDIHQVIEQEKDALLQEYQSKLAKKIKLA